MKFILETIDRLERSSHSTYFFFYFSTGDHLVQWSGTVKLVFNFGTGS